MHMLRKSEKMQSLAQKPKAEIASLFVGVTQRDNKRRPKVLIVPGSEGKRYQVIIRRFENLADKIVTCECRLETGHGYLGCLGNGHRKGTETLCYHSQAAIDFCLKEVHLKGFWCSSYEDALKLNQMKKGQVLEIRSHQSSGRKWVVISKEYEQLELPLRVS